MSIARMKTALVIFAVACAPEGAFAIANGIIVSQATYNSTFPWAAALYDPANGGVCTGVLISPTYVLTAAHCAGVPTALVGAADRTTIAPISIDNALVHPSYDAVNHYYDVALLHLATPVYNTKPVKLTTQAQANSYLKPNRAATIAGWGYTTSPGTYSNLLTQHGIVMSGLTLQNTWMVFLDQTSGPCAGDSGGPLIVQVSGGVGPVLMGLADVTNGDLCAPPGGGISGYTNIAQMLTFINSTNVPDLGQTLPPNAFADQATTTQDRAVAVAVAANDMGFGSPLTVAVVTAPAHGTAVVTGSPGSPSAIRITYTPAAGYAGNDSLVYSITDGVSSDTASVTLSVLTDTDRDGVPDSQDNCTLVYNPDQRDTNGDGYGNICDPDLDNNGTVNINDLNRLKMSIDKLPVVDVDADLDGNGVVNVNDLNRLKWYLGNPPGPSGLHP